MGIRGPKPMPNGLKKLAGVRKSRINNTPNVPKLRKGEPPDYLDELGREKWNELYPILSKAEMIRSTDSGILAVCCDAYSVWRTANKELHKTKSLQVETPNGGVQQAPIVATERNAKLVYMRALAELGLTPSSLSRLHADPPANSVADELGAFMEAGKRDAGKTGN